MSTSLNRLLLPTIGRAWLLAVLLLAAQAAGLAHRMAHAPGQQGGQTSAMRAAQAADSPWSASHPAGSAACQLVDQLAHADALCGTVFAQPALPVYADAAPAPAAAWLPARPAQAYRARAPPRA